MTRRKNHEYYVVIKGRHLDKPTIFSSWAKAHLHVTGCHAIHKAFYNFQSAVSHLQKKGFPDYRIDVRSQQEDTSPQKNGPVFYAVANGKQPGIFELYDGQGGAKDSADQYKHACHKSFKTKEQAEEFIQDWEETWLRIVTSTLTQRLRCMQRPSQGSDLFDTNLVEASDRLTAQLDAFRIA